MTFDQSAKDEIKQAADIVSLIGQFVQLRKAGKNYVGLCPFHGEKAPSFSVSPDRQMFHCFGCKRGGDIFAFWMEYHGLTFPEALRDLADRYQIQIPDQHTTVEDRKKAKFRETLFKINELAAEYFQKGLEHSEEGKNARYYLEKRAIPENIIKEFRLGYAPERWDGLKKYLISRKISLEAAVEAGVLKKSDKGHKYDLFRGRIIFPILDLTQKKRIIGFGGRVLGDTLPKYVNTPETPLFHKGTCLYGFSASRRAIRDKGRAVLVEGYMDCLALQRHGINEAVATLGTALSESPLRKLKGLAGEVVVVFDADEAGKTAALRTLPLFLNEGLSAGAVMLPDGHDPDSFVNDRGPDAFIKLLDAAPSLFDVYVDEKLKQSRGKIDHRVHVLEEMLPILRNMVNETQRAVYARRLAEKSNVSETVILSALDPSRKSRKEPAASDETGQQFATLNTRRPIGDIQLLSLLLHYPETIKHFSGDDLSGMIADPMISRIVGAVIAEDGNRDQVSVDVIQKKLEREEDRVWLREFVFRPPFCAPEEIEQAVADFKNRVLKKKIADSLRMAMGNPEAINKVLKLKIETGRP